MRYARYAEGMPNLASPKTILPRALFAAALAILTGCAGSQPEPLPPRPQIVADTPPAASAGPSPLDAASANDPTPPDVGHAYAADAFPVEAMVGQIAGQPIYAHQILGGLELQLGNLGRRLPSAAFENQARALILEQVRGLVQDALLRDEAERNLAPSQREQLAFFVDFQRQEYLRRFGQGSVALAERNILEQTGLTLEQNLREFRTGFVIRTYLDRNLRPLVNVTRRDIERYYRDNYDAFNPPTRREFQLIYADSDANAVWFQEQLEAGVPFAELALSERNAFGGRDMALKVEANDTMFGPAIDPHVQGLAEGEWAGPLNNPARGQQWFVYVSVLDEPERRSLFEAQVDIERELRTRQERELQIQLGEKLRRSASFTDERRMTEAVLAIAVSRYAPPDGES
ncbi:MAG: peptidylprolyl isomerase [Planctomycetota bacterium]